MLRALTTHRREDPPNIAEERATSIEIASLPRPTERGLLPQHEAPPQVIDTPGASGHAKKVEGLLSLARRGSFGMLRALPSFLRKGDSKASFRKGNDSRVSDNGDRETSSRWKSSTCRSFLSGEGIARSNRVVPFNVFPIEHDHARARRNWRVMRAVLMALGKWRDKFRRQVI